MFITFILGSFDCASQVAQGATVPHVHRRQENKGEADTAAEYIAVGYCNAECPVLP